MTDPTPLPLSELERLEREATRGEWKWDWQDRTADEVESYTVVAVQGLPHNPYLERVAATRREKRGHANASLIAALRNNATALFAVVRAAQAFKADALAAPIDAGTGLRHYDLANHGGPVGDLFAALQPFTEPEATDE